MEKTILSVLTTSFLCFGSCYIATAQAPVAQSDQITDDGSQQTIQDDGSTTGKFEPVTVDPSASSDSPQIVGVVQFEVPSPAE